MNSPRLRTLDNLLTALGGRQPLSLRRALIAQVSASASYGLILGSWDLSEANRWSIPLYNAIKLPLLTLATTLLCLPAFFVLNTAAGVRHDFTNALRAIIGAQAAFALALVSLAPVTLLIYVSSVTRDGAILANIATFSVATSAGQIVLLRRYRPLRESRRIHSVLVWGWLLMFAFVGIQMGWTLRPFVGSPGIEPSFFRQNAFSNAYIRVIEIIARSF